MSSPKNDALTCGKRGFAVIKMGWLEASVMVVGKIGSVYYT